MPAQIHAAAICGAVPKYMLFEKLMNSLKEKSIEVTENVLKTTPFEL